MALQKTVAKMVAEDSVVASFFAGKDVLITGASGFLGRVLIEKLLREAPDIGTLFLLLRPKRGCPAHERIATFTDVSLFERVRKERPGALGKLRGVEGDAALPGLGLSAGDRQRLEERVAVVFHAAASVRFDDPLQNAVLLNVRGTRDLCELALRMPRLQAFVYVSTAYSNADRFVIDEKLYPPPGDWKTYITAAETMDSRILDVLTFKLLGKHANTYVFTKSMAEHVVNDYSPKLPIGIIRPSIVIGSEVEPFPGWLDNLNGPSSVLLASLLGITHVFLNDSTKFLDVIPVDYVVAGIVLESVQLGTNRKPNILPLCNATSYKKYIYDFSVLINDNYYFTSETPIQRVYKKYYYFVKSLFLFKILFLVLDLPISLTLDTISWCTKQQRRMMKIHRRAVVGITKTSYFSLNHFEFSNNNFLSLTNVLDPKESENYKLSTEHILIQPLLQGMTREVKKYFFPKQKVNPGKQETALEFLHVIICGIILYVLWKSNVMTHLMCSSLNILKFFLAI